MFANQDEPDKSACALEVAEALQLRQVNHRLQQEIAERILIERQLAASRQALEQQLQWMRLLRHITDNIRANLSTEHIVQTAARELGQALEVSRCLIHAYKDAPQPHLVPVAEYLAVGVLSLAGKPVPFENNPHFDKVIGQDRAVVTDCCADEPMLAARQEQRQVSGVKSIMAVRTSYQGQINGAIGIHQCDRVRSWQNEEIQLVEAVAAQVGIALAQVQLLEQERRGREQLAWQANHDSLTKLLNRHAFEQHLAVAVKSAHRHGYRHALCFLDIDQFRIVNDICGHRAGDELLRQITALLIAHLQSSDTLARLGGDEFGLLLFECSPESARQFIEHLLERMSRFRFSWEGNNFTIGASVGVVAIDRAHMLDNLLSAANVACAQAKNTGRNRVCIWQPDDEQLQQQRGYMQWVTRIHRALEDNTFCLYTQKIVPTTGPQTGEHYEVLIRLRDEQGKIIAPMAFIPAAERYNLMGQIDRWVIETLFAGQAEHYRRNWEQVREGGPECLYCVNLSGASINDERFVHFVIGQFEQHRVPPQLICFEITETQAIANLSRASELIHALKDLGCHFALDDFGSGTSSFDYLKNLPVDYLKIDGAFIKNIVEDPVDRTIVASITNVAKLMGVRTIAEFVENQAILDLVCELGIDYAQGYGIARPEPIGG